MRCAQNEKCVYTKSYAAAKAVLHRPKAKEAAAISEYLFDCQGIVRGMSSVLVPARSIVRHDWFVS